jgi:hypothetical protein
MTKQEFIAKQREMTRGANKRSAIWIVFFFGGLVGCAALSGYIDRHPEEYRWIGAAVGIGLFAFLIANSALMLWFGVRQQRRFGHRCPHCNKALVGFSVQIAIATGNCGHCGERVFNDHAA